MLLDRNEHKIDETNKEVAFKVEWQRVALAKLNKKFYDVLEFRRFTVKGIKVNEYVTTFRIKKMSDFLIDNVERFRQMLEMDLGGKQTSFDEEQQSVESGGGKFDETKREASVTKASVQHA